jgi:hypothetical protein
VLGFADVCRSRGKVQTVNLSNFRTHSTTAACLFLALLVCCASARSQEPPAPKPQVKEKPAAKPSFTLAVKTKPILNLSLKAEKAKMSEVAHELSQRLKIPVFLGPERQKELISIEFSQLTLEPALQLMSPTVYVDYELDTGSGNPPKALGIYFYDLNQGEPPTTAVVAGPNQAMLVEGHTEDGVEPATDEEKKKREEEPLRIRYENGVLTVKAKKQPLPLVMLKIGEELGIPIDIQNERMDPIDADISKLPIDDAVRQLSPNIKLYYRADLTRAEKRALRIVLAEPAKVAQPGP